MDFLQQRLRVEEMKPILHTSPLHKPIEDGDITISRFQIVAIPIQSVAIPIQRNSNSERGQKAYRTEPGLTRQNPGLPDRTRAYPVEPGLIRPMDQPIG